MRRFFRKVRFYIDYVQPNHVLDFGCGEAFFWSEILKLGAIPSVTGLDVRDDALDMARATFPEMRFVNESLFTFDRGNEMYDLVIASQVFEHLTNPSRYLARLCKLSARWVLVTVPHEPFFRWCNFLRGRDLLRLGNHPEHIQHWSLRSFAGFMNRFVKIHYCDSVFPFLLVLGEKTIRGKVCES